MDITFLLLDGFSQLIFSCLLEPLRVIEQQYHDDIRWHLVSLDDQPVRSSSNLLVAPSRPLSEIESPDLFIIISSEGFRQNPPPETMCLLTALVRQSQTILGADAGAWILAAMGFLDDLRATTHWSILAEFAETFPHVDVTRDPFVMEGRFWSCGGASTAMDLMLAYISQTLGPTKAFWASSMFMHDAGPHRDEAHRLTTMTRPEDSKVRDIMNIMVDHIEHPLPLSTLAEQAYVSPRTLNRLFHSRVGSSPGHYYQSLRLARARDLAETTAFDVRDIALRCGYNDAAALSKAYKRLYGHSIRRSSLSSDKQTPALEKSTIPGTR